MSGTDPREPWWLRPGGAPLRGLPPAQTPPQQAPQRLPLIRAAAPQALPQRSKGRNNWTRLRVIIAGTIVIVVMEALALVVGLWIVGHFNARVLDVRKAEAGVKGILTDPIYGYGAIDVDSVSCNKGQDPKIKAGEGFTCQVIVNGASRQVSVVFRDNAGTYEVDGPR